MRSNNMTKFERGWLKADGSTLEIATLGYYEAYSLFAMAKKNVRALDEEILKGVKLHKKKLFFIIVYDEMGDEFRLLGIIYDAPLSKCIKIINAIIKRFNDRDVINDKTIKPTYVQINLRF